MSTCTKCDRTAVKRGKAAGVLCSVHLRSYNQNMISDGTGVFEGLSHNEVMAARGYDPVTRTYVDTTPVGMRFDQSWMSA